MNTQTKKVAESIADWFDNYASVYEFDSGVQFEDFSIKDLKSVNKNDLWEIIAPKLKELVIDYVDCEIQDREGE